MIKCNRQHAYNKKCVACMDARESQGGQIVCDTAESLDYSEEEIIKECEYAEEKLNHGYHWECKYCDGTRAVQSPYEEKGFFVCADCGAEWLDCKIQVPNEEY